MKKLFLAAAATLGLSGCMTYDGFDGYGSYGSYGGYGGYGGYGSGVSVTIGSSSGGYGGGYGYGGYGYGSGYGSGSCVAYDRYGRAYYTCGYGNYTNSNRYIYSPNTAVYYYPGYTYRSGYYYDSQNRRYDGQSLYERHHHRRH